MPSQTRSPLTFVSDPAVGTTAWQDPGKAAANDATYATASGGLGGAVSAYLKGTDCSFAIPSNATILGIELRIDRKCSGASTVDNIVTLVQDGTVSGDDKASPATWPTTDAYAEYGGETDLWGLTWIPAQINASDFGAVISATILSMATAYIDHVKITVTYKVPAPAYILGGGMVH